MKILTPGKFDKKFFLLLLIFIIIVTSKCSIEEFYFKKILIMSINISLNILMYFGFSIFFVIPEIIMRKAKIKKGENTNKNWNNNIIYIFNKPKKMILKGITVLILIFILYLVFLYASNIYFFIHEEKYPLVEDEGNRSFEIIYFLLLSLIIDKTHFYIHHYIPLIIMIFMGIIRFIINLIHINYEFVFPHDLLFLFLGVIIPLIESTLFFTIQKYMKYKYYSPFFIYFLMGAIFSILALIIYLIFMNVDCGEKDICLILSMETIVNIERFAVFVIYSLMHSLYFFIVIVAINIFSVFHYFLFISFERLIVAIFSFSEYTIFEQIILIVTFIIEIFAILVFIEIIILNFCGFNYNIKKNIMFRAEYEIGQLEKVNDNDDNSINDGNVFIEFQNLNNNNINDDQSTFF